MNEDRQQIWNEYKGPKNGPMRRMFLEYDRYFEAGLIADALGKIGNVDFTKFSVIDFGCGVADYGIHFARLGAKVDLLDIDMDALKFAEWRFKREGLSVYHVPYPNLVIFGEVLDHLVDPHYVITAACDQGARFIFTSSYPFRSDDPSDVHWKHDHHPASARLQQSACRDFLNNYYNKINFGGERNLWTKK